MQKRPPPAGEGKAGVGKFLLTGKNAVFMRFKSLFIRNILRKNVILPIVPPSEILYYKKNNYKNITVLNFRHRFCCANHSHLLSGSLSCETVFIIPAGFVLSKRVGTVKGGISCRKGKE